METLAATIFLCLLQTANNNKKYTNYAAYWSNFVQNLCELQDTLKFPHRKFSVTIPFVDVNIQNTNSNKKSSFWLRPISMTIFVRSVWYLRQTEE